MKNKYSILACLIISIIIVSFRFTPENYKKDKSVVVTTWDALGYYIYLPSIFIYNDFNKLEWFPEIDKEYSDRISQNIMQKKIAYDSWKRKCDYYNGVFYSKEIDDMQSILDKLK